MKKFSPSESTIELVTAEAPKFNSYAFTVNDLAINNRYEFYYSATNILGTTFTSKNLIYIPGNEPFSNGNDIQLTRTNASL